MTVNANQFPEVYRQLGVDVDNLGCIMLDVDKIPVTSFVVDGEDDLYFSPTKEFVQGAVAETKAHITLLYGLMESGKKWKPQVDAVLATWDQPKTVEIDSIEVFPSYGEEEYSCIVGRVTVTPALQEGHDRLRTLPHIDWFPEFKVHVTLAYVKPEATTEWVESLSPLVGKGLTVATNLNYGK